MTEVIVHLDSTASTRAELERCASGIAALTPEFTKLQEEMGVVEESLEIAEALATVKMADDHPKATATELKARVVKAVCDDETGTGKLYGRRSELRARLVVIDRRFRSLEKRLSAAQTAMNSHLEEARSAGFLDGRK
jgi:hypothetical protein